MDTANKIAHLDEHDYECRVMGVPKQSIMIYMEQTTVRYGSAAICCNKLMEIYHDATVYDTPMVTIVELWEEMPLVNSSKSTCY